jgi:hypothetical protein
VSYMPKSYPDLFPSTPPPNRESFSWEHGQLLGISLHADFRHKNRFTTSSVNIHRGRDVRLTARLELGGHLLGDLIRNRHKLPSVLRTT